MDMFESFPEQDEAKRLLRSALADGPAHAYLFHGPPGVGKRRAAFAVAAELLGDRERVERRTHPDLYLLEPLGDQIRIDAVRALRRDLHMRPFEGDARVYVIVGAHLLNDEAADALLKDLEEPPPYAVVLLLADELGPLPETIRSRCQLVPFRRLSERAVRSEIEARAPALSQEETTALARAAGGRLDRAERLLDPQASQRRADLIAVARAVYAEAEFDPAAAAGVLLEAAGVRAAGARASAERELESLDLTARESEQRLRRAARGAEREQLLESLEELAAWYRDLLVVGLGADSAAVNVDRLRELRGDAVPERLDGAEEAAEAVRETWRRLDEYQLQADLALEALFITLRGSLAGRVAAELSA